MKDNNILVRAAYLFLGIFCILATILLGVGYFLYINGVRL